MDWYLYLCLGMLALGPFVVAVAIHADIRRRAFNKAMATRPAVPLETIYSEGGYASLVSEPQFVSLWTKIARAIEVDPCRVSPSDTFDQLRPQVFLGWGEPDGFDLLELLPRDRRHLVKQVRTVDDFLQLTLRDDRLA
jgi:hypothetical protein